MNASGAAVLDTEIAIVGAGFGGLCMAIKLREAGKTDFVILEKGHNVGGTWRDNTYPGCACDVQSHLYSYSFEGKPDWSRRYAGWKEIQSYVEHCADKYDLLCHIRFGQAVSSARFDASTGRWTLQTRAGLTVRARTWVLATGPLHHPAMPSFKGQETFAGPAFHSAQWRHDVDLTNKRVVSIGTGASAIQYLPEIAKSVKELTVLQRTPAWVIPRDVRTYGKWQQSLFAAAPLFRKLHRAGLYWQNEARVLPMLNPRLAQAFGKVASLWLRYQVRDAELRRRLTPDYTMGCKRVLISNDYYPTFSQPHVNLVTSAIKEIRPNGVVTADGREHPADVLIYGTGFISDPRVYMERFDVRGLNDQPLTEAWRAGADAYLGMTVAGYPNMFQLVGPNTALGHNSVIFMIEAQVRYVMSCLSLLDAKSETAYMHVRRDVMDAFNRRVQDGLVNTVWSTGCKSWYQQDDGKNLVIWPYSTWRYWLETRRANEEDFHFGHARPDQHASRDNRGPLLGAM